MKGWRFAFFSFLICLPAFVIVGTGAWVAVGSLPRLTRAETMRIRQEYRDIAERMIETASRKEKSVPRPKGWRQAGKIDGIAWGYVVEGEQTTVWHATGKKTCKMQSVATIPRFPYRKVVLFGGLAAALLLFGLSAGAVTAFHRYLKVRDDFLAATAHDLTTPLVGLRRMIGHDDEEAVRLVERLLLIVNNLKGFLALGGRRTAPVRTRFDLAGACRRAYELFREDYRDLFGGRDVEIGATGACEVEADETLAMQVLWNLFGNDLKYAAPYGKVEVRVSCEGRRVVAVFVDEGPGLTALERHRAFDRYYRAKTVLENGKGGFGIGLCTAREFARAMGGALTVGANEPKGCIFSFSLPAAGGIERT